MPISKSLTNVRFPHPLLFRRFLAAVGLDSKQILEGTPDVATVAWIETMKALDARRNFFDHMYTRLKECRGADHSGGLTGHLKENFAAEGHAVQDITATNMPRLSGMGQTVLREEER
jgi:hypothetical protein